MAGGPAGGLHPAVASLALVETRRIRCAIFMALGAAYTRNALANPYLYRAMFDTAADLENPAAADAGFQTLVAGAERARQAGRFAASCDPVAVATQLWAAGHGQLMLVLTGVLPTRSPRLAGDRHRLGAVRGRRRRSGPLPSVSHWRLDCSDASPSGCRGVPRRSGAAAGSSRARYSSCDVLLLLDLLLDPAEARAPTR